MRHVYAPFIGRVVSACRARLDGASDTDVTGLVSTALVELARTRALFDALEPAVLRGTESTARALHDVGVCFELVRTALNGIAEAAQHRPPDPPETGRDSAGGAESARREASDVSEPLLAGALEPLEGAASELWRALDVLGSIQAGEASYSPFPTLNLAIKVGMNVLDEALPSPSLDPWLPQVDAVVTRLAARVDRFCALHDDAPQPLVDAACALVADLAAGAGALHTFLKGTLGAPKSLGDTAERTALLDGLRLLRHGSEGLAAALEEMDRFVRQSARWSTMPAIEDFCRAALAESPFIDDCAASIEHFMRFLDAQVEALRALPMAFTIPDEIESFATDVSLSRSAFGDARQHPDPETLQRMQDAIAMARRGRDTALGALEREMDAVASSPHLEELKELAGRYLHGAISESLLRERVIAWLKAHALLEMQLRDSARAALGSDAGELLSLLHQQGEGIEETTRFFRDGDTRHLVEGFRKMAEPLAALAEIRERVLRSLRPATGAPTMITCFGCATPNAPGRTHCRTCGQRLPEIARAVAPTAVADDAPTPSPRNIERLERIVQAYEQHQATAGDIQYECGLFLGRLGHIRRDFERRFVPRLRAERSVALINMARDFYENLTALQDGLYDMLAFGDHGRPDGLYRGLSEAVEAGRAMRAAQERIEEVLVEL